MTSTRSPTSSNTTSATCPTPRPSLNPKTIPYFEAVAPKGDGVYETLKAIARLILTELKKGT